MSWSDVVDVIGSPVAGLSVLVESAGVPFPGEVLLFGAATWAAARHQPIAVVILFGFLGSTAGADIGYFLGFKGGRPFVERFGSVFHIQPGHLARSELFFARYGDKSLLAAHFLLGLRTWGSMLAGMARMPFWRFQLLSAAGGLLWAAIIGLAGYLLGSNLALLETLIRGAGLVGLVIVVALPIILVVALRRVTAASGKRRD